MINADISLYKSLFNDTGFAVIIKEVGGYVLEANDAAAEMFGYDSKELTSKKREDLLLFDEQTASDYKHDIDKFKKKSTRADAIRKNGEIFPIKFFLFFIDSDHTKKVCLFINDISEEIEKEKKLERTVEILEETNKIARVGGYEVDMETGKSLWTKETKEIHELPLDYEPRLEEAILFYREGEVRDTITKLVQDAIDHGTPYAVEVPLTTAKNNERWVRITGNTEFKDGKCVRLYGIVQDIHEAKLMQDDLMNERTMLRTLIDHLPVAIFVKDNQGRRLIANKADLRNIGVEKEEETIGKTNLELFINNLNKDSYQRDLQVLDTGQPSIDVLETFSDKIGNELICLTSKYPIFDNDGNVSGLVGICRDITEQRKIEDRLKLFEKAITHSRDAILIASAEAIDGIDTPILYTNEAFTEITGYTLDEVKGKNPRILQGPLSDRTELGKLKHAIKNWLTCEVEIINYKKNGTAFWSNISIVPIADEKGWFTHWVAIQRDVTARKESEKAFNEMSALQKSILDSANLAIISTDTDGIIRSFNQGAEHVLGYTAKEVVDRVKPRIFHDVRELEEKAKKVSEETGQHIKSSLELLVAIAKETDAEEEEWTYIHKDGHRIPVSLSVTSLLDASKKEIGYLGIAKDITVEKQIREALRLSNMMLEDTISELKQQQFAVDQHAIVSITDVQGTIIYANEGFCKISKYTQDELIGQNHRIIKSGLHPNSLFSEMYHTIANGKVWKGDICNRAKDGSLYWVSNTIVPYMDPKTNKPMRYVSIRTDITDKKLAEIERENLLHELTDSNRELKQFSYITTHNLRAPLTNLISICNLIKTDTITDPLTLRLIDGFKRSTHDLHETLKDLINVLIIKQNINLPSDEVNFGEMLDKVVESISKSIEKSGTTILSDFSLAPTVHFYGTYMESILLNLITNSIKYAKPDEKPVIRIVTSKNIDGTTRFEFSDNGIGMNMERVRHKIFGLYQRFHNNPDSKGIGLYLIHSQINAFGGKIDFYSEENMGTTFTITFK